MRRSPRPQPALRSGEWSSLCWFSWPDNAPQHRACQVARCRGILVSTNGGTTMAEHDEPGREAHEKELEAFRQRQLEELREFEERQKKELEAFERQEREELQEFEEREHPYDIKIDRTEFKVKEHFRTGAQLRALPNPPI